MKFEYKIEEFTGVFGFWDWLNNRGLQGWELVHVEYSISKIARICIFKKQIKD